MIPYYAQGVGKFPPVRGDWKKHFKVPTTKSYLIVFKRNGKRYITSAVCKFHYGTKSPFRDSGAEWQVLDQYERITMCISPYQVEAWFYRKNKEKDYA